MRNTNRILLAVLIAAVLVAPGVLSMKKPIRNPWECVEIDEKGHDYCPASDMYTEGDELEFSTYIRNTCKYPVMLNPIMYYNQVTESCGKDLTETTILMNEKKLDKCHQKGMDEQETADIKYYGKIWLKPGQEKEITFTKEIVDADLRKAKLACAGKACERVCNYYQLDIGRGINNRHDLDEIWSWGFIRVCKDW